MGRFGKFMTKHVFNDNNLVRAHEVDNWLKPIGSAFGNAGRILGGVGAVYTLFWARNRFIEQKEEAKRKRLEHELKLRKQYGYYLEMKTRGL